jgi:hypothetical protein
MRDGSGAPTLNVPLDMPPMITLMRRFNNDDLHGLMQFNWFEQFRRRDTWFAAADGLRLKSANWKPSLPAMRIERGIWRRPCSDGDKDEEDSYDRSQRVTDWRNGNLYDDSLCAAPSQGANGSQGAIPRCL